jgi:hypothetical protein
MIKKSQQNYFKPSNVKRKLTEAPLILLNEKVKSYVTASFVSTLID